MSSASVRQDGAGARRWWMIFTSKHDSIYNTFRMQKKYLHNTMMMNSKWTHIAALPLGHVDHRCRDGAWWMMSCWFVGACIRFFVSRAHKLTAPNTHHYVYQSIIHILPLGRRLQLWYYEEASRGRSDDRKSCCDVVFASLKNDGHHNQSLLWQHQLSPAMPNTLSYDEIEDHLYCVL